MSALNERDRRTGRILLQRGLVSREVLQQAGTQTVQRRQQSGQDVDLLMVLVDMGSLTRPNASAVWRALSQGEGHATGSHPRPTAPAAPAPSPGDQAVPGSFFHAGSSSSTVLRTPVTEQAPSSFDPTGNMAGVGAPPPAGAFGAPPAHNEFSASAPTLVGTFDVAGAKAAYDPDDEPTMATDGPLAPPGPPAPTGWGSPSGPPPGAPSGFGAPAPSGFGAPAPSGFGSSAPSGFGSSAPSGFGSPAPSGFGGGPGGAPAALGNPPGDGLAPSWAGSTPSFGAPPPAADPFASVSKSPGFELPPKTTSEELTGSSEPAGQGSTATSRKKPKKGKGGPRRSVAGRRSLADRAKAPAKKGSSKAVAIAVAATGCLLVVGALAWYFVAGPGAGEPSDDGPKTAATTGGAPDEGPAPDPPPPDEGDPLLVKPDEPLTPEEVNKRGEAVGDRLLGKASDMAFEREQYEEAVQLLETFPDWLHKATIYKVIKEKRAEYNTYAGFRKQLRDAVAKGAQSSELRQAVQKVEGGGLSDDLLELPCVKQFRKDARGILGESGYDEIALKAADLDEIDDMESTGLED